MNFTINTTPMTHGVIVQEVISDCGLKDMKEVLFRQVIQTQDAEIEKALVVMGWTPPGKTAELVAKAGDVMRERCLNRPHPPYADYLADGFIRALPGVTLEDLK